ncbi:double zinc ribbon domain-containing protein [Candidatus Leptofilum sp.]|uniref:double zinc ribbon domain-containing protein n=1 Tax=Candidatus Leptofilum sp. TaxID=3241576 RepID=UPI003B59A5D4
MSNEILVQLACPSCTHPINIKEQGQHLECPACRSQLLLDGHVCPNCGEYHKVDSGFCRACGTAMTRTCERCHTRNWSGAEYCQDCGAALDIFQLLHLHNKQTTMNRLDEQMREAEFFKEKEKADSERRMATLLEQEQARVQAIRERQATQKKQDQQLIFTAVFVLSIFILIVTAFAVL